MKRPTPITARPTNSLMGCSPCWAKYPKTACATTFPTATTVSRTPNAAPLDETLTMSRTSANNNVGKQAWELAMRPTHKAAGTVVAPKARDVNPATAATAASKMGAAADGARSDANPTAGASSTDASGTSDATNPAF